LTTIYAIAPFPGTTIGHPGSTKFLNMETIRTRNNYRRMSHLADLTKQYIIKGNLKRVNDCLAIAEHQFRTGTTEMKNAVANGFLFSLTCFLEMHRAAFRIVLPELLEKEYVKQINSCGA
jgi:hypothetical protein